jgi:hypothetical protein
MVKPSDPFSFHTMTPSAMSRHAALMAAPTESDSTDTVRKWPGILLGGVGSSVQKST